jgi:hypothetical protein
MLTTIVDGHPDLSDLFLLVALILFAVEACLVLAKQSVAVLIPAGLAFLAAAWLVL